LKTLIAISEEEYEDIIFCLNCMDADLGSIVGSDDLEYVLKNVKCISKDWSKLRKIFME
jgi:hypothetical protein